MDDRHRRRGFRFSYKAPFFITNHQTFIKNNVHSQNVKIHSRFSAKCMTSHTLTHLKWSLINWALHQAENICQLPSVCLSAPPDPTSRYLRLSLQHSYLPHLRPTGTHVRRHTHTHTRARSTASCDAAERASDGAGSLCKESHLKCLQRKTGTAGGGKGMRNTAGSETRPSIHECSQGNRDKHVSARSFRSTLRPFGELDLAWSFEVVQFGRPAAQTQAPDPPKTPSVIVGRPKVAP